MKVTLIIQILIFSFVTQAHSSELKSELNNKPSATKYKTFEKCYILYDMSKGNIINNYNKNICAKRLPPDSSFKVPLSLMAFDNKIINQNTVFQWNLNKWNPANLPKNDPALLMYLSHWTEDQTPKTWLEYSVVWVSQDITPQIGLKKIQSYLSMFNYGNQDFTGDKGKNNGLTHAWISSSLKISGKEQLMFLISMFNYKLQIDKTAIDNTISNLPLKYKQNDLVVYGKTGSGYNGKLRNGWFIGYAIKNQQKYLVVTNISDIYPTDNKQMIGITAKDYALDRLIKL